MYILLKLLNLLATKYKAPQIFLAVHSNPDPENKLNQHDGF